MASHATLPADVGTIRRRSSRVATGPEACRRKFMHLFPGGFGDETYLAWERDYKWHAHLRWNEQLGQGAIADLIGRGAYGEIAGRAVRIESRTNLLFSFEKMALRDAVRSGRGAKAFAIGLYDFLYGEGPPRDKFERWCAVVGSLPRVQTRVLTWPVVTVFGFIALPRTHVFLKPNVTRIAAAEYGYDFAYASRPSWPTYASLLSFARRVRGDLRDLRPRDMIDIQSFIWVLGSDEY